MKTKRHGSFHDNPPTTSHCHQRCLTTNASTHHNINLLSMFFPPPSACVTLRLPLPAEKVLPTLFSQATTVAAAPVSQHEGHHLHSTCLLFLHEHHSMQESRGTTIEGREQPLECQGSVKPTEMLFLTDRIQARKKSQLSMPADRSRAEQRSENSTAPRSPPAQLQPV
jgi:hypothetical protein